MGPPVPSESSSSHCRILRLTVRIITSCTGLKRPTHRTSEAPAGDPLSLAELRTAGGDGAASAPPRAADLGSSPARALYAGQQHARLMRGVDRIGLRIASGETVLARPDLWILSAGFGLLHEGEEVPPYEVTFQGMPKADLRSWADTLGIPDRVASVLAKPADLQLVLLGDSYWDAVDLQPEVSLGGPTLLVCGSAKARTLATPKGSKIIALRRDTARRFSCGLVGLKGELAARLLLWLQEDPKQTASRLARVTDPETTGDDILDILIDVPATAPITPDVYERAGVEPQDLFSEAGLDETRSEPGRTLSHEGVDATIDYEVAVSADWRAQSAERRIKYFIPDWDDLVDPDFDFQAEAYSRGRGGWHREVYAHQLYAPRPNYDGVLVSRSVFEERATVDKRAFIYRYGIHHYLRLPPDIPVLGDCGAFSYKDDLNPPFSTADVLAYYTALGFDLGVSVDHLAVVADSDDERQRRQDLTLRNADDFLREHRALGLTWEPIGAVQGWDPASYARAAAKTVALGYDRIAVGGVVRARTLEIIAILEAVHQAVTAETDRHIDVHVFGVARLEATADFARLGVTSVDSASPLRTAWTDATKNYWSLDGKAYAAIRIPVPKGHGPERPEADRLEAEALASVRAYAAGSSTQVKPVLDALQAYHHVVRPGKAFKRDHIELTLRDRPWDRCPCAVCQHRGVEVAIFRGNNRNRRRGFHNTYVFYELLGRALAGNATRMMRAVDREPEPAPLFG